MPKRNFAVLFAAHHPHVLRFTQRRVSDEQVAEDIVGDTFELAWTRMLDGHEIDRPWLFVTASFKLRDHYKRSSRQRSAEAALERLIEEPIVQLTTLDRIALHEAMRRLSDREREALRLSYWDGVPAAEIATLLGCSTSAVWVLLSRARAKLRVALES